MCDERRHSLACKALTYLIKAVFILGLTTLLTRWAMTLWPIPRILHTDWGMGAYLWLQRLFNLNGCEDGEDMLILLTLSLTLMVSTLTCLALTKALRKWRRAPIDQNVE